MNSNREIVSFWLEIVHAMHFTCLEEEIFDYLMLYE